MKQLYYKKCSHVFHFIMCLLTGFLWLIVWIACAAHVSRHNRTVTNYRQHQQHEETTELLRVIAAQGQGHKALEEVK